MNMFRVLRNIGFYAFVWLAVLAFSGCSAEAKRKRHLSRADAYFAKGDYQKAEIEYINAARLGQIDLKINSRLGAIYHAQGRILEAQQFLLETKKLNPADLENAYRLGTYYTSVRQMAEARQEALFILGKEATNAPAVLLLADAVTTPEQILTVRQTLRGMTGQVANAWAVRVGLAQLALRENRPLDAEKEAQAALRLNPAAPEVHFTLGQVALALSQTNKFEPFLKAAMESASWRSPFRFHWVRLKMQDTNGWIEAKQTLKGVLEKAPDYVPAWTLLADLALAQSDYAEAEKICTQVLSWNPYGYDIRIRRARAALLQKETDKAMKDFTFLESAYKFSTEVRYEKAIALLQDGKVPEAFQSLDEALRINPSYPPAVLLKAELKLRTGDALAAINSLQSYSSLNPGDIKARLLLANAFRIHGDFNDALGIYRQMLASFPKIPELHAMAGMIYRQQGNRAEARASFEQALSFSPFYIAAAEEILDLDLAQKRFNEAKKLVDEQLVRHTNSPGALMLQAKYFLLHAETNAAKAALQEVLKKAPEASAPYIILAQINFALGENAKALGDLRKAVELNPRDVGSLLQLGMAYDLEKNYSKARECYDSALKLNPRLALAWNNLAYLLAERFNQLPEASAAALKARELAPTDPSTADTLGWIYFKKGEFPQALALCRDAAASPLLKNNPDVHYHLARVQYAMGLEDAARASLQQAIALKLTGDELKDATRRLSVLSTDLKSGSVSIAALEEAVSKDPNDYSAVFRLAETLLQSGSYQKALPAYERAAKLNAFVSAPLVRQAEIYADRLKDVAKGLEFAKAARKVSPNEPAIAGLLGRLSLQAGDYPGAAALLQEYVRTKSSNPELLYELGLSLYGVGQFPQSRQALQDYLSRGNTLQRGESVRGLVTLLDFYAGKADATASRAIATARLQQQATDLPALMTLGLVAQAAADLSAAVDKFNAVLAVNKNFAPAQRQLALLLAEDATKAERTVELATKARSTYPADPVLAKALGKAALQKGDYRVAINALNEVIGQNAADDEALFLLGSAYAKSKNAAQARQVFTKVVSANPPSKFAGEAAKQIKELR